MSATFGDSCVAQSELGRAAAAVHECDGEQEQNPIPQSRLSLPPVPSGSSLGCSPRGLWLLVWHIQVRLCWWLWSHHGHPTWASPSSTVSLFSRSIAVHFSLFKQDVTGNSCWAQQQLSSVELRTQRWFHKSHFLSASTMRHVCILRKAFCIQPIPHVFRGRF